EIGIFKITSEAGIGAGTRRIEAVTSKEAYLYLDDKLTILEKSAQALKTNADEVPTRINKLFKDIAELEKENESLQAKSAHSQEAELLNNVEEINSMNVLLKKVDDKNMDELRRMVDELNTKIDKRIII